MQLSKENRKKLANELKYCADKIAKERDARTKIYFYRNAAESVNSLNDLEYDSHTVLMGLVLEVTGNLLTSRIDTTLSEKGNTMSLSEGLFDKLSACLNELSSEVTEDQETYKTLEKISELAYANTERGYYFYTQGIIKT
jgi:hypothetical protein